MDLEVLASTIDGLSRADPASYADTGSIRALHRLQARLDAIVTRATAAFDAAGNWAPDGARNAPAWLATECHLSKARARGMVRRGRALRHLPECTRAWSEGTITADQVDTVAALRSEVTADALARDEAVLVEQAGSLRFEAFRRVADYWRQLADPDGVEEDEALRRSRRDVYLDRSLGGMWLGKITLDPISGAIVGDEFERLERALFEADWAKARADLGREPTTADLSRTPGQRRADALVEMATRSRAAPADGRRPAPLFSVLVGYETLQGRICELAGGAVVSPGSLLPWLDQALIERAVFKPGPRVEVSATTRLFTGATRHAIELRDRECTHPYCDIPARSCEMDHIVPFSAGGATTEQNGRALCGFHNRLRNQRPPPDG